MGTAVAVSAVLTAGLGATHKLTAYAETNLLFTSVHAGKLMWDRCNTLAALAETKVSTTLVRGSLFGHITWPDHVKVVGDPQRDHLSLLQNTSVLQEVVECVLKSTNNIL